MLEKGSSRWKQVTSMSVVAGKAEYNYTVTDVGPGQSYQFRVDVHGDVNGAARDAFEGFASDWAHVPTECKGVTAFYWYAYHSNIVFNGGGGGGCWWLLFACVLSFRLTWCFCCCCCFVCLLFVLVFVGFVCVCFICLLGFLCVFYQQLVTLPCAKSQRN